MVKTIIQTNNAPAPIGPYNQAVLAGNMLFLSGQIALIPGTNDLNMATIQDETTQVMHNIKAILDAADYAFTDVVKTSIFLSDMTLFSAVNEVYGTYFTSDFPARETIAVKTLPRNVNVEITMTAVK